MASSPTFWLLLTLLCLAVQAFYSMMEMAAISFNKVRLEYYLAKNKPAAIWLSTLLQRPSQLFGTTLLGVNVALQIGSECSRHFYASLDLNPSFAALTQACFVVVFAELAPMAAGRRYAEHAVMLGIGLVYFSSKILAPFTLVIDYMFRAIQWLLGKKDSGPPPFSISREEMEKALEAHEEQGDRAQGERSIFNHIAQNIFAVRSQTAKQVMTPLAALQMAPSNASVRQIWHTMHKTTATRLPLYHQTRSNILAIVSPRELLDKPFQKPALDYARPPWFILEQATLLEVLQQFQTNGQSIAVVLNASGAATGILTLEDIVDEIFGKELPSVRQASFYRDFPLIDRTFSASLSLSELNCQYSLSLHDDKAISLAEFAQKHLHRTPEQGDVFRIGRLEFTIEEASLLGAKTISIRTLP